MEAGNSTEFFGRVSVHLHPQAFPKCPSPVPQLQCYYSPGGLLIPAVYECPKAQNLPGASVQDSSS
ncbi:hypothetical protein STEG23_035524, partial [Scotinomys teguina]